MKFRSIACRLIGLLGMIAAPFCASANPPGPCTWGSMQPPAHWGLKKPINVCRTSDGKIISANAECVNTGITVVQLAKLFSVSSESCTVHYEDRALNYECHVGENETILGTLTGPSGCANFSASYLSYIAHHPFVSD